MNQCVRVLLGKGNQSYWKKLFNKVIIKCMMLFGVGIKTIPNACNYVNIVLNSRYQSLLYTNIISQINSITKASRKKTLNPEQTHVRTQVPET